MGRMVGIHTKDEDWQLHLLGHLNLDRNFFSAIIAGDWGIVISNVQARGALTGGP